jgi:hypothetical protein
VEQPFDRFPFSSERQSRGRYLLADHYPFSGWIELMVNWPCLRRVVRREGIAIESNEHEFRTAGPARGAKRQNLKLLFLHP